MAFFPSSSGFIINGGNFTSFNFGTEGDGPFFFPNLLIDDTEYSRNTGTRKRDRQDLDGLTV